MRAKAIVFPEAEQVCIKEIQVPEPKEDEVLTKTIYTGISTGTEMMLWRGKHPERDGEVVFPMVPGYGNVGEIIKIGENVDLEEGQRVFIGGTDFIKEFCVAWGGHVQYAVKKATKAIALPDNVTSDEATFINLISIVVHGLRRISPKEKDTIAIVGQGIIGQLCTQIAKLYGAKVFAIDLHDERLSKARKSGADHVINASREDAQVVVKKLTGKGVDISINATGISGTIDGSIRLLREKAWGPCVKCNPKFLFLGFYEGKICLTYDPLFSKEVDLYVARSCTLEDQKEALNLLMTGKVEARGLISEVVDYRDAEQTYAELAGEPKEISRIILNWQG